MSKALEIIEECLKEIPDYREFMTVDELNESSRRLVEKYPDIASLERVGVASNGEPIYALRIKTEEAKHQALCFAFPHPNEPIGSLTLEYLSWKLCEDAKFRKAFKVNWYIVKCADPFGARLNEGWFKGPFEPRKYALNYYRPPGYRQVEWTFPIEYKRLKWDRPTPETKAIMNIIDQAKPIFMASLHNAGFCGVYFYLSDPMPKVYPLLHALVRGQGLPLHRGEPEVPWAVKLEEAIFKMPFVTETYDYLEKYSDKDPAKVIKHGASSDEYAKRVNPEVLTVVCEVPYIYDERVHNTTEIGVPLRDIVLLRLSKREDSLKFFKQHLDEVEEYVDKTSPFYESLKEFIRYGFEYLEAERKWATTDPKLERSATVAEAFDAIVERIYWSNMLMCGLMIRLMEDSIRKASGRGREVLRRCEDEVKGFFEKQVSMFERLSKYEVIPLRKTVTIQLGAILYTMGAKVGIL
ncbi:MAG: peptidase M14 [Thermoprotei archaeon]|nr:MAG: peptidase M14 [Thermoprotei archaeon]